MSTAAPLRIVMDARYLDGGYSGIGDYSRHLIEALARIDAVNQYEVLVHESFKRQLAVGGNFRLHPAPERPLSWGTLATVDGRMRALRPDVVHSHCPVIPPRPPRPLVVTIHDLQPLEMPEWHGGRPWPLPWCYRRFYGWMYPHAFARAARLIAVSEATRAALLKRWPRYAGKTDAIPSGFTPEPPPDRPEERWEALRREHGLPERCVLYIGSTRPNKNLPGMLRAFARMRRARPELGDVGFVLVLAADRFLAEIRTTIAREGLGDAVRILPQVPAPEKAVLLAHTRALFFATRLEGFGFPILEAQAAGVPVLTSDADAAPETAGEGALLAAPGDSGALAEALGRLLTDETLRARLIAAGRSNTKRFEWETTARRTLEVYRLAARPRNVPNG